MTQGLLVQYNVAPPMEIPDSFRITMAGSVRLRKDLFIDELILLTGNMASLKLHFQVIDKKIFLLNRYKVSLRISLAAWLDVWYELEALNSLANFAYLNPGINQKKDAVCPRPLQPKILCRWKRMNNQMCIHLSAGR